MSPAASRVLDSGSFRDRDGRVYRPGGRIIRGLSAEALEQFEKLQSTAFHAQFLEQGKLVGSERLATGEVPLAQAERERWAGFIEHQRIPVISYPYEWTFSMLQEAAQLQLELVEAAIREDMTLKDATPYNIQFVSGRPVFIDIASFETLQPGAPWAGYRQFCEMFLFPLMLQAYKGLNFQPLMRSSIDGVSVQTAARLFGLRDRFRAGVLTHVWLQSKLDRRYGGSARDVRTDLKSAGFNKELILANVRKLRKLVAGLEWGGEGSEWGDYEEFHNYSERDQALKESFVDECVAESAAALVWDIGCNTGRFSRIAAAHVEQVLAMDLDHLAVERLYREVRGGAAENILTLVQNVADPSPSWGWRNRERLELGQRARPDLVLCLALIHHVVISANVPLDEFIDWLAELSDQLIIEFVSREDDKVQALLRNKEDKYSDYSQEGLEKALGRHFDIRRMQGLESGNRFLYWCSRPLAAADEAADYETRLRNEQAHFDSYVNVNALPEIFSYWSNKYLVPMLSPHGFTSPDEFFLKFIRERCVRSPETNCAIASVGAGECDLEIELARRLMADGIGNFRLDCLEVNPNVIERAKSRLGDPGLDEQICFLREDFNQWRPPADQYDVVMANQALHHVVELEHLFDSIALGMKGDGLFLVSDMIGRNGHQRWPEALEVVNEFWEELPDPYRFNRQLQRHEGRFINHDCSSSGFEGIRAQDILPLLVERFHFRLFLPYGNAVFVFIDRAFGHNFDASAPWDRNFIDRVHAADERGFRDGRLKPTALLAALTLEPAETALRDPRLTPRFCIREPES